LLGKGDQVHYDTRRSKAVKGAKALILATSTVTKELRLFATADGVGSGFSILGYRQVLPEIEQQVRP
jgi:hypothetical protein